MTDDQLVLALITSYKNRGVDMSKLLDDPLFSKLPAWSKIKAIQENADALYEGVNPSFDGTDAKRVATNAFFSGLGGAGAGLALGRALAGMGGIPVKGAVATGAALMGITGALAGGVKAYGNVDDRRAVRNSLDVARKNPSVPNAIGVLSGGHASAASRSLRDNILDRITGIINEAGNTHIQPVVLSTHEALVEMNKLKNMQ